VKGGNAEVLHIFSTVFFIEKCFEALLIIPVIWGNFYILTVISFSFWYKTEQLREMKVFICSLILLFITILLLTGSLHLKAIVFLLHFEIFSSYLEAAVYSLCIEICSASSKPTNVTWSSTNSVS
jgi:hypothetical protein